MIAFLLSCFVGEFYIGRHCVMLSMLCCLCCIVCIRNVCSDCYSWILVMLSIRVQLFWQAIHIIKYLCPIMLTLHPIAACNKRLTSSEEAFTCSHMPSSKSFCFTWCIIKLILLHIPTHLKDHLLIYFINELEIPPNKLFISPANKSIKTIYRLHLVNIQRIKNILSVIRLCRSTNIIINAPMW